MPAVSQDVTHYKGDTLRVTIAVLDGAGSNVDLGGAGVTWWMGKAVSAAGSDVYIKKTLGHGIALSHDTAGLYVITIDIDPADTESLAVGTFYHECAVIDADGNISRVTIGKYILKPTLIPDSDVTPP